MARNLITVSESDLGAGIDQQSSENRIQPGFSEDLINVDPKAEGYLAKRPGYQGVAGYVPVRVSRVDVNGTDLCFTLDASADLTSVSSSPIIVYGRLSDGPSIDDFETGTTNDSVKYYDKFTVQDQVILEAASTSLVIPASEHGQSGLFAIRTFVINENEQNETFFLTDYSISQSTGDLTLNYGVAEDTPIYIAYTPLVSVPGDTYIASIPATAGGSISAATHQLSNFNILTDFYEDVGGEWVSVTPDTVEIDNDGEVSFSLSESKDIVVVLRRVAFAQRQDLAIPATSGTATIDSNTSPFVNVQVYVRSSAAAPYELAFMDTVAVNPSTKQITVDWTSTTEFGYSIIYWEPVTVVSNKFCVMMDTAATTDGIDYSPQITIWGLSHKEIYGDSPEEEQSGWVNHIDSYRAAGNNRIVCGLGGNLFAEYFRQEAGIADNYLLPTVYPNIRARIDGSQTLGPAFYGLTEDIGRTNGCYKFFGGEESVARAVTCEWQSGTTVRYALQTLDRVDEGTPNLIGQYLTVTQAANKKNNGTFIITAVNDTDPDTLVIDVTNPNRTNADYDETGSWMQAGIFTDTLDLQTASPFLLGDRILATTLSPAELLTVSYSTGNSVIISGIDKEITFNDNQRIAAERTSYTMPLRDQLENATVENLVRGDMLSVTGYDRLVRVVDINPLDTQSVTVAGDVVSSIADTSVLRVGQRITLVGVGESDGTYVINEVIDASSVRLTTEVTNGTYTLIGKTVDLDEALLYNDTVNSQFTVAVSSRWIPIEAPTDAFTNTLKTHTRYLTANTPGSQPILKSTMVSDNMYFSNGDDGVLKWDGSALVRAGLPRWNAQMYVTKDTTATSKIVLSLASQDSAYDRTAGSPIFKFDEYLTAPFTVGDTVTIENSAGQKIECTIVRQWRDTTSSFDYIQVDYIGNLDNDIGTAHPFTMRQTATYKYYFRLNALDNNDNLIASAVTGVDDSTIKLDQDALIRIKLIQMPAWDIYDFDKLELQVYRTKKNGVAPYYLVQTVPLSFNDSSNYIQVRDAISDQDLIDLDPISTALEGAELGTQWSHPVRSKYVTSAGNRLVLGNVVGDPIIDISVVKESRDVAITEGDFDGESIIFRKDNTDTETASDNENRQKFVFLSSGELTISNMAFDSEHIYVTTSAPHGLSVGDWVYLFHEEEVNARCVQDGGWWKVADTDTNTFTIDYLNTITPILSLTSAAFSTSVQFTANATSINTSNHKVTITGHGLVDGQIIMFSGSDLPAPLNDVTRYKIDYIDANEFYIHTLSDVLVELTTTGSGTVSINKLVNYTSHGLTTGQQVSISGEDVPNGILVNEPYFIYTVDANNFFLLNPDSSSISITDTGSGDIDLYNVIRSDRVAVAPEGTDFPVWIGQDGNTQTSVGNTPAIQLRAMMRLATAINAHQTYLSTPWMMAEAGNLVGNGRILVSQPKTFPTILEAEVSSGLTDNMQVFGNGLKIPRTVSGSPVYSIGAVEYQFPSRILISYPNFPEIFSNPTAAVDSESISVIDVNSADGQEITGVIPFFGESAFGAAQKSGVVVVFKTNSIYLVDINAKAAGINPVQRIESQGLGCSAPHSIANTRDGIMFANESGLYRLGRNMAIEYVGQKVERVWRERVNRNQLDRVFGHHYGTGSQYKVSVPLDGNTAPGDLLVYSHVREYRGGFGAWTRYSNHSAIGWANLFSDAFFATTDGQVMSVRRTGGVSDFRDDSQPISAEMLLRALDFGDSGIRKTVRFLVIKFRVVADTSSTLVYTARDLVENYEQADSFTIEDTRNQLTGVSDPNTVKVVSIRFSPKEKESVYFQTLITNAELDQPVEIVEVSYRVSGMTEMGIPQAATTTKD